MTILAVTENRDSPSGSTTFDGGPVYFREFTAYCSSVLDGPKTLLGSGTFPSVGSSWLYGGETDPFVICQSISVSKQEDHGRWTDGTTCYIWDVKCEFRVEQADNTTPPNIPENPLLRPVVVRGGTGFYTEASQKDKDDKPVTNSAKETFPPYEIERPLVEFEFVRNELSSPASFALNYVGKINQTTIWGGAAKTIRCQGITWEKQYENGYEFFQVTYKFAYREEKWQLVLVDNGFNEVVSSKLKPILLDDGSRPTEPQKLNGSGVKLSDTADPVLLPPFNIYKETNFASLGLPTSI
ncbi:hypothetical protein EBZ39_03710 [bacterium]|nr:hypothetical protein [bacterium]